MRRTLASRISTSADYVKWINQPDAPVIFTHQFVTRVLKTHWDAQSGQKAVILIFDGLRVDAWEELVRPVLEEKYDVVDELKGSAILPSETHLSRKAISAGCLPDQLRQHERERPAGKRPQDPPGTDSEVQGREAG